MEVKKNEKREKLLIEITLIKYLIEEEKHLNTWDCSPKYFGLAESE